MMLRRASLLPPLLTALPLAAQQGPPCAGPAVFADSQARDTRLTAALTALGAAPLCRRPDRTVYRVLVLPGRGDPLLVTFTRQGTRTWHTASRLDGPQLRQVRAQRAPAGAWEQFVQTLAAAEDWTVIREEERLRSSMYEERGDSLTPVPVLQSDATVWHLEEATPTGYRRVTVVGRLEPGRMDAFFAACQQLVRLAGLSPGS